MENTVTIEVTSAFLVEGEVVLPGQTVEVLRTEALALVVRGKARLTEAGEVDEAVPEPGDAVGAGLEERPARGRRGKG